ncbi:MAG: hypothetical protein ACTSRU_17185 [Candidatus Hodarchaeales archaeon]
MTTTIKINDDTKARFDKLKAKIFLETGKKLTQQEILELLLEVAEDGEEEIMLRLSGITFPPSEEDRKKFRLLQKDFGFDTSKVDQDKIIYED